MGEGFRVGEVVDGDDVEVFFQVIDAENLTANSAKAIDRYFEFHTEEVRMWFV